MTPPPVHAATTDDDIPAASHDAPILDHAYDGIREYDNPLPGWWRAGFWASIVFAAGYFIYFHVGHWASTPAERYRAALADYEDNRALRDAEDAKNVSEELLARNANNGTILAHGAEIFAGRCASCHNPDGRGLIGPNLTDTFQIHGTTRMDLYATIKGGAPGTAMPAWGEQLAPADVVAVASFVTTLRGTNAPGGKEPQGKPVERFK